MKFMPFCIPSIPVKVNYTKLPDFGGQLVFSARTTRFVMCAFITIYQCKHERLSYQQKTSPSKEDEEAADQDGRNASDATHQAES